MLLLLAWELLNLTRNAEYMYRLAVGVIEQAESHML